MHHILGDISCMHAPGALTSNPVRGLQSTDHTTHGGRTWPPALGFQPTSSPAPHLQWLQGCCFMLSRWGAVQGKRGTARTLGTPKQAPGAMCARHEPYMASQVMGKATGQQRGGWHTHREAAEDSSSTWLNLPVLLAKA